MINLDDFYKVMCAMVPLYVAMFLAYGSVKWWKIFSPEQCSGINRFVAVFAVPILSFHFISQNNPYNMDPKFILADTISKILVLLILSLWVKVSSKGSLDWLITFFSISTLPNTLVMGIPLLGAMYGDFTEALMVQLVVLQCIIWYTLLLFLFEYRAATLLIANQFPGVGAASISKFQVDGDVVSLDGQDPLRTETEVAGDGRILVKIRRSCSSFAGDSTLSSGKSHGLPPSMPSSIAITPRPSNLSNAEIYSVHSSKPNTPTPEIFPGNSKVSSPRISGYASSDVYSLQPTPRTSNFNEGEATWVRGLPSPAGARPYGQGFRQAGRYSPAFSGGRMAGNGKPARVEEVGKEFGGLFVWGSPAATETCRGFGSSGVDMAEKGVGETELSFTLRSEFAAATDEENPKHDTTAKQEMPRTFVMLRLILTMVGRKLARNPNTYSSVLGLMWSLISFKWNVGMPSIVKYSIKIISNAGLGMAMFSLGLFMALQPRIIACGIRTATLGMAIRFVGGPVLMSAASIAIGLRGVPLYVAIVQAALPQGIVPFVFAREYGLHPDILSTGVIFGMLVSLPVTLLYYIFLGL